MRNCFAANPLALIFSAGLPLVANFCPAQTNEAAPRGGGTDYFQDKNGGWWDAYFGNDNQSPFREKPAIVKIDFDDGGKIFVAKKQPDFVLQKSDNK
jgi:hypothetical protein